MQDTDDVTLEPEDGEGNEQNAGQKLKDLREELKKARKERDEYLDSLQRMKADYINAKKRFETERESIREYAAERLVLELLPILDTFEQALAHGNTQDGLERIYAQILKMLSAEGVSAFSPEGEQFNPALHESVETLAVTTKSEDNTVTKVHQKGYALNGRTIRPARVAVGHYQE